MVDVFRGGCISIPFSDIKTEKSFIGMVLRVFDQAFEVDIEIRDQVLVKILPEKMCYDMSGSRIGQGTDVPTSTMCASDNTCVAIADGFL